MVSSAIAQKVNLGEAPWVGIQRAQARYEDFPSGFPKQPRLSVGPFLCHTLSLCFVRFPGTEGPVPPWIRCQALPYPHIYSLLH